MPEFQAHASCDIETGAKIGKGTRIWHWSHVMKGAEIGENCVLGQNCFIGAKVKIHNGVKIQNNVSVYDAVILEENVFCGPSMVFTNVINPRSNIERKTEYKTTRVRTGASIGANATIICGVTIGEYAFIGAGAVITRDVANFALVFGNPGRQRGWICRCGVKLTDKNEAREMSCKSCGVKYCAKANALELA